MKRFVPLALRLILGLIFVATSVAAIFQLLPAPTNYPPAALAFGGALAGSGYMMVAVWTVQLVSGLALLFDLWTPLFLVILAPVTVNIVLFHLFLTPRAMLSAGAPGILVFLLNAALLWLYRSYYRGMLTFRSRLGDP
jgi:putative oxidoreductase